MKKSVLLLGLIAFFFAQPSLYSQKIGIRAGLNMSTMFRSTEIGGRQTQDFKLRPGFHIGTIVNVPVSEILSFETGLLLNTKGYRINKKSEMSGTIVKFNLLYIDIPVTAKTSFQVGNKTIFANIGPYVGIGLAGNVRSVYTLGDETETIEQDFQWGQNNEDLKRLEYGLLIGGGVEFNSFVVALNYSHGFTNISLFDFDDFTLKNRVIALSIGYNFGKNL